jgi:hypothetical protein
LPEFAEELLGLPRLLASEIRFVVGLSDAERTRQGKLGDIVLIERADVLVVGLLELRLGLRDGKVVRNAGVEALLGFGEFFASEVDVGSGGIDQLGSGLDVQNGVADISVDLLDLVGEARPGLAESGFSQIFFATGAGELEDGGGHLARSGKGAVRVARRCADVAKVSGEAGGRELIRDGGLELGFTGVNLLGAGL